MTNKINGIDVSECKYLNKVVNEEPYCNIDEEHLYTCSSDDNCYFKQLKRLQEENEELKKRQITKNGFICDCEQNAKYKQALEEIKKWATNHNPCDIDAEVKCTKEDCFNCLNYDIKKITKIIDEVLNGRD